MDTPILDMLRGYSERNTMRLHMPGHKGRLDKFDITEIEGADSLFEPCGVIKKSEENAGGIFGADTFYSTEGSSLPIRAMVYLTAIYAKSRGENALILAQRNVHKSFISALALCGVSVEWMLPEKNPGYLSCPVSAEEIKKAITEKKPTAVYITSPDYLGKVADIRAIAKVCKETGVLLLVDNAHGAYLRFLSPSKHPISLGASMCCDSAHKTLNVLGGGAYLHLSKDAPKIFKERAKEAMSLFATTSPSYLILASLDRVNPELFCEYPAVLSSFVDKTGAFNNKIGELGYINVSQEPLKITIDAAEYGYTGFELSSKLAESDIICEFSDREYLVMMLSPYMNDAELEGLYSALSSIPRKERIVKPAIPYSLPKRILSPREAAFSTSKILPIDSCLGRVLASVTVSCPPAVPVIVSGELIDEDTLRVARYYGIKEFSVIE